MVNNGTVVTRRGNKEYIQHGSQSSEVDDVVNTRHKHRKTRTK